MIKSLRFLVLTVFVVFAFGLASASPEDAYRASLERLKAGDYDGAIAALQQESAAMTTEAGPRATALELIGRYEVGTNRIDLGVRHLSEALAVMSPTFAADHPRVVSVKRQIIEAERKRF